MSGIDPDLEGKIKNWILARKSELVDIPPDYDLIENRAIDSLHFAEFVLLLEELTGREIPFERINLDHFRTLVLIRENFLPKGNAC